MQALVVDDSRAMRAILTRLMTGLVDWNMPVMDGVIKPFTDEVIAAKLDLLGLVAT